MIELIAQWQLAWPWLLAAAPLPLLAAWLLPPAPSTLDSALRVPFGTEVGALAGAAGSARRPRVSVWWLAIWLLLCIAAARPQQLGDPIQPPHSGRNLLLVVDLSGSMAAEPSTRARRSQPIRPRPRPWPRRPGPTTPPQTCLG